MGPRDPHPIPVIWGTLELPTPKCAKSLAVHCLPGCFATALESWPDPSHPKRAILETTPATEQQQTSEVPTTPLPSGRFAPIRRLIVSPGVNCAFQPSTL